MPMRSINCPCGPSSRTASRLTRIAIRKAGSCSGVENASPAAARAKLSAASVASNWAWVICHRLVWLSSLRRSVST